MIRIEILGNTHTLSLLVYALVLEPSLSLSFCVSLSIFHFLCLRHPFFSFLCFRYSSLYDLVWHPRLRKSEKCMQELFLERALCSTPSSNLAMKEIMSKEL
ncbi:hypothetical protein KP509_01G038100 [Ceratopteris richardii]|uniref:Uncharacterized protein n=1 Tax=Ceratopteris richardii TaxID=49495 RepID=A0A8T2VC76_CERRI|nr:hypothetical protein KP509_01G038100 [Ceratopteris richardii]